MNLNMQEKWEQSKSVLRQHRRLTGCILVCLLLLTIIGYIGYGRLKEARERGIATVCVGNLKLIWLVSMQYKEKYGASPFDSAADVNEVLNRLVNTGLLWQTERTVLKCGGMHGYDYVFVKPSDQIQPTPIMQHAIMRDPDKNAHSSQGIIVLFEDGHTELNPKSSPR